jgi:hypothetical protein
MLYFGMWCGVMWCGVVWQIWHEVKDLFPLEENSRRSTSDIGAAGRTGE